MAGHSKWANIKRRKQAVDIARGKIFTKLSREIQVAAREGGPDPEANVRLRLAIEKARSENMPKENIERAIRRGAGLEKGAAEYEQVRYEGYGPHGVAILVECLTDNRNRTISEVRRLFTRAGGNLGEPGSVAWQFEEKGYIAIQLQDEDGSSRGLDPEAIFEAALEAGAEDVEISDDVVEIYTERNELSQVAQALEAQGFRPDTTELIMQPKATLQLAPEAAVSVLGLVEALEELDDVNKVYHNLEITDEVVAQFA